MLKRWMVMLTAFLLAACGSTPVTSAGTANPSSATLSAPSYEQVLNAMRSAHSVHESKQAGSVIADIRAEASGAVAGIFTIAGGGSLQFFATEATFEAVGDAAFVANCGCSVKPTPGVCQVFSSAIMAAVGLTPSDLAGFTPAGQAQGLAAAAPAMTIQTTATVNGVLTHVFTGSGRELDVPTEGPLLPIRLTRPGVYETVFSEWNTATPTKPTSCV